MPYSTPSGPANTPLPVHSNGRPGHRRSFSNSAPYAGAFQSLGALPRARITPTSPPRFHIGSDNDDDDSDDASDSPPPSNPDTTLKVKLPPSSIQFPRVSVTSPTSPLPPPAPFSERSTTASPAPLSPAVHPQPRPAVARTTSSPIILLSNGKPLKSSLKSRSPSSSSTSLSTSSSSASINGSAHTRAASAPNTPHLDSLPSPTFADEDGARTPSTPKNVHFAPPDSLRNVRVFSRSAKPAAISSPGVDTETETDGTGTESERFNWSSGGITWGSGKGRRRWSEYSNTSFPFPKIPVSAEAMDVANADKKPTPVYTLSPQSSPIPAPYRDPTASIHIESIKLISTPPSSHPSSAPSEAPFSSSFPPLGHHAPVAVPDQGRVDLEGSVLVRNISFEKSVYIRFTLDGWQTTSEVSAHHVRSLSCLPPLPGMTTRQYAQSAPSAFQGGRVEWDRFEFKIPLSDYPRLHERTLWLVGRYVANHGEYWDNNRNENYKILFERRENDDVSKAPTLNGNGVDSGVVDPAPAPQPETLPTPTGPRQRHTLTPLVTQPLTLPALPRSVRRRGVESGDMDSDADSEHVPFKSNVDSPKVSMDVGSRERSGSLTSPEAVQVMQNALGKLNFKNYARPRTITSPTFFVPPPSSIQTRLEPASPPKADDKSTVAFPPRDEGVSNGSNTSTPESSPVLSTPPLSRTSSDATTKEVRWPWGESTVTSPTAPHDSNKGYAALIQQWCFATTPDTRDSVEVA